MTSVTRVDREEMRTKDLYELIAPLGDLSTVMQTLNRAAIDPIRWVSWIGYDLLRVSVT